MPKSLKDRLPKSGVEKPETAGQKIKQFLDSQDGYQAEAADVLIPMFRDLERIILNIRHEQRDNPCYYIVSHSQKNPMLGGALHIRTFWRKTEPQKGFNLDCYKVTNPGDNFQWLWTIPSEAVCRSIASNPSMYDPQLAKCCVEFLRSISAKLIA